MSDSGRWTGKDHEGIEVFGGADRFHPAAGGGWDPSRAWLAEMARILPLLTLIDGGQTLFQPVFVGDVARAVGKAVMGEIRADTIYELGGPDVMTFQELMEFVLTAIGCRRLLVSISLTI